MENTNPLCVGFPQFPNGFIAHFYAVCEQISPVLAWGFLGPKSSLHDFCCFFKVRTRVDIVLIIFISLPSVFWLKCTTCVEAFREHKTDLLSTNLESQYLGFLE